MGSGPARPEGPSFVVIKLRSTLPRRLGVALDAAKDLAYLPGAIGTHRENHEVCGALTAEAAQDLPLGRALHAASS